MRNNEEQFLLYLEFYKNWFKNNRLGYVNGNFFLYRKNIISIHTKEEIIKLTESTGLCTFNYRYFEGKNHFSLELINSKYELPGARIIRNRQFVFSYSEISENYDESDLRICLVAEYNKTINNKCPNFEDYNYRFQIFTKQQLLEFQTTKIHEIDNNLIVENNTSDKQPAFLRYAINKKHDYKTIFELPPEGHLFSEHHFCARGISLFNYNWFNATGIGIYSGGGSKIRCIDIDGCNNTVFLDSFLESLGLNKYYDWVVYTGSNDGFHIWIWCDDDIPNTVLLKGEARSQFKKNHVLFFAPRKEYENTFKVIELRWNSFCMLPPSYGPSGHQYKFRYGLPKLGKNISIDKILDSLSAVGYNTSIIQDSIIYRDFTMGWSNSEELEVKFLCIDTETTGLPNDYNKPFTDTDNWPHIVQLSYILFVYKGDKIKILKEKDFILSPDKTYKVPEESTRIHGISDKKARKEGFERKDVLNFLAHQLEYVDYIIGHNIDFDINVLRAEFTRENIDVDESFEHIKKVCTMKSSMPLYSKLSKWPKLEDLYYDLTDNPMIGAHNSLNDVRATIVCFNKLIEKGIIDVDKTMNYYDFKKPADQWGT